jgi:hypothetical protein
MTAQESPSPRNILIAELGERYDQLGERVRKIEEAIQAAHRQEVFKGFLDEYARRARTPGVKVMTEEAAKASRRAMEIAKCVVLMPRGASLAAPSGVGNDMLNIDREADNEYGSWLIENGTEAIHVVANPWTGTPVSVVRTLDDDRADLMKIDQPLDALAWALAWIGVR